MHIFLRKNNSAQSLTDIYEKILGARFTKKEYFLNRNIIPIQQNGRIAPRIRPAHLFQYFSGIYVRNLFIFLHFDLLFFKIIPVAKWVGHLTLPLQLWPISLTKYQGRKFYSFFVSSFRHHLITIVMIILSSSCSIFANLFSFIMIFKHRNVHCLKNSFVSHILSTNYVQLENKTGHVIKFAQAFRISLDSWTKAKEIIVLGSLEEQWALHSWPK